MAGAHAWAFAHGLTMFLLATGCGRKVVHRPGEEWLEAIRIEGNRAISDKDLRAGLALGRVQQQRAAPDPYLVVVDGQRIEGEYVRRGFLEVDVRSRVERRGLATTVIYTVEEGPRAKTRVMITGIPDDKPELRAKIRAALPLEDGAYFSYEPYDEAKQKLLAIPQDAGYAHAELDAHVVADSATHEAIIHLDYELGPVCTFGRIEINGVSGELRDAVRGRVAFEPGERYSASAIAETQRRLYDMRRFSTVRVLPIKSDGDVVDVRISLARSARNELALGGGVGMDPATYEVRVRTGYSRIGWPFPLTDFTIDLRPAYAMLRDGNGSEPRVRAIASLRRTDLFRPFVIGEVEGGYNYLTVEAYTSFGPHARLGLEAPVFTRRVRARVGWEIERLDFRHISPLIGPALQMQLGLDGPERVGMYTQTLAIDLRDDPIEPTLGIYAEARVDEGTQLAGGALDFFRVTPELRGFVPVPELPIVLAGRVRAGKIFGDIPPTERYFSGGASSHRGFGERRLAPTVRGEVDGSIESVPIGGAELFETSFEVRSRLTKVRGMDLGAVTFLDGGDVTEPDTLDLGNLNWAVGVGLRLFTIVGPVRADVGYRLNRTGPGNPEPGSHFAFHLSVGEAF